MSSRSPHGLSLIQDLLNTLWSHTPLKARQKSSRLCFAQMIQAGRQLPHFLEICLVSMLGKFFHEIFYKPRIGYDEHHASFETVLNSYESKYKTRLHTIIYFKHWQSSWRSRLTCVNSLMFDCRTQRRWKDWVLVRGNLDEGGISIWRNWTTLEAQKRTKRKFSGTHTLIRTVNFSPR